MGGGFRSDGHLGGITKVNFLLASTHRCDFRLNDVLLNSVCFNLINHSLLDHLHHHKLLHQLLSHNGSLCHLFGHNFDGSQARQGVNDLLHLLHRWLLLQLLLLLLDLGLHSQVDLPDLLLDVSGGLLVDRAPGEQFVLNRASRQLIGVSHLQCWELDVVFCPHSPLPPHLSVAVCDQHIVWLVQASRPSTELLLCQLGEGQGGRGGDEQDEGGGGDHL